MLLLVAVLIAEQVLSNRFYRPREEKQPDAASLARDFKAAEHAENQPAAVGATSSPS
jgi:hypothetical protein